MPPSNHPNLLVGTNTADDAGVFLLREDLAIVQTIDVFTPVVDDPYDYGQIAAANSLSDIYAMGARPLTALNFVGFPKKHLSLDVLTDILRGAADKTNEAGCPVVGGHTIEDDELKFGLSVTGEVHPDRIVRNSMARVGDKIILTKPLGMGILSTALKNDKLDPATTKKITTIMAELNKTASERMLEYETHAATDVTGFGLLGHLYEMAVASNVSVGIHADAVPYLEETLKIMNLGGFVPGGTWSNQRYLKQKVTFAKNIDQNLQIILFDAQTSGGLLIAVAPGQAEDLLADLQKHGIQYASLIGEVIPKEKESRIIVE